jgi:hypothetical protein
VEDRPGVKSAEKIKAFVANVRAAAEKYRSEKVS